MKSCCRRPVLAKGVLRRTLSAQATTTSHIPNDPDILTTQDATVNEPISEASRNVVNDGLPNPSQKYPRLQYRAPSLGVNPAYDLALEVIKQDRATMLSKYYSTNQKIKKLSSISSPSTLVQSQLRDMTLYANKLRELADLNDPEIHWRHAKGDTDLSMHVYRYLAQRSWAAKPLKLLMQRVQQMSVIPDVIPLISPIVDVRLLFPFDSRPRKGHFEVGGFLTSAETSTLPDVEIQSFDAEEKTYSIAIVDPDVPHEPTDSFTSYLHYLKRNVVLSATKHAVEKSAGEVLCDYVPPHPHQGTPYHRYTVVVWEQPKNAATGQSPSSSTSIAREGFDAQKYAQQNGLHAVGINFWRSVWDDKIESVMQDHPAAEYVEKLYKRIKA